MYWRSELSSFNLKWKFIYLIIVWIYHLPLFLASANQTITKHITNTYLSSSISSSISSSMTLVGEESDWAPWRWSLMSFLMSSNVFPFLTSSSAWQNGFCDFHLISENNRLLWNWNWNWLHYIELFEFDSQWLFLTLWNYHLRLRYQHHLAKNMKFPLEECYYQWPPYNHLQILSWYYHWLWALSKHHNNVGWFHQETFLSNDYIR